MRKRFAFVAAMTVETVCGDATHDPSFPAGGDPVTTGSSFAIDVVQQHLSTRATRRMGPCVRRDDADVIAATATHRSPLTIRRPRAGGDPVTTGSSLCADVINQHLSTRAARRMGPCVRRNDTDVVAARCVISARPTPVHGRWRL